MKYILNVEEDNYINIIKRNDFFGKYMEEEKFRKLTSMQQGYFVALVANLGLVAMNHLMGKIQDTNLKNEINRLQKSKVYTRQIEFMNYQFLKDAGFEVPDKTISPLEEVQNKVEESLAEKFIAYCPVKRRYISSQNELARILSSRIAIVNNEHEDLFFGYNGKTYEPVGDNVIKKASRKVINESNPNAWCNALEREYLDAYKHEIPSIKDLKSGKNIVAFDNRLFDLNTGMPMDFSPAYYITSKVEYEYEKDSDCPRFKAFLKEIFSGDMERVNFIQQLMGYLLIYDRSLPYIYIFISSGRSGKSVLTSVITKMLGSQKVSNTQLSRINTNFGLQSFKGTHLNISSESELDGKGINTELLKAISGNDIIEVERKYKDPVSLDLGTRLVISTNQNLKFNDSSNAIYERLLFIPFDYRFLADPTEAEKQGCKVADPQLEKKLEKELPGIFKFAYEGLEKLRSNGMKFDIPNICKEKRREFQDYNNPIKVFVDEHIEFDENSVVSRTELREAFEKWQEDYSQCVKINTSQVAAQIIDYIKENNPTLSFIDKKFSNSRVTEGMGLKDMT